MRKLKKLEDIICDVVFGISLVVIGMAIGIGWCKFIPGFWMLVSKGIL